MARLEAHIPPRREVKNHSIDSTRWDGFVFRPGDVVIATWAKGGTTWLQQIVGQLVFRGAAGVPVLDVSPWIDRRGIPKEALFALLEKQTHRRFVKTHLPADALPIVPEARYIYIGRDGRDVVWSWYNHHRNLSPKVFEYMNSLPDRVGPPFEPLTCDVRQCFHRWLDEDGYPLWPFWSLVRSWWDMREQPNVLLMHFNDLKTDLEGQIRRIARFLDIEIDDAVWPDIVRHSTFEYMKRNAATLSAILDSSFVGGAETFIHKGTGGGWRDVLTPAEVQKYKAAAEKNLGAECALWLETGQIVSTRLGSARAAG